MTSATRNLVRRKETKKESITRLSSAAIATTQHWLHSTTNGGQTNTLAGHWVSLCWHQSQLCLQRAKSREPHIYYASVPSTVASFKGLLLKLYCNWIAPLISLTTKLPLVQEGNNWAIGELTIVPSGPWQDNKTQAFELARFSARQDQKIKKVGILKMIL